MLLPEVWPAYMDRTQHRVITSNNHTDQHVIFFLFPDEHNMYAMGTFKTKPKNRVVTPKTARATCVVRALVVSRLVANERHAQVI